MKIDMEDIENILLLVFIICIIGVISLFIKKYFDDLPDEPVQVEQIEPIKDGLPLRYTKYIGDVGTGKLYIIEIENLNVYHRYLLFDGGRSSTMVKISEKENILPDIK